MVDPPQPDGCVQQQVAQRRERRYLLVVAVLLPLVGVGFGAVIWAVGPGPAMTGRTVFVMGLAIALLVVLSAIVLAFVWWRRRRGSALFARSPLWELPSFRQRSRFVKALRRGAPIPPELHDLAVRVARDIIRRRRVTWLWLGIGVLQTANFFLQDGWSRWSALVMALCALGLAGYYPWLTSRMRSALARLEA